MPTISQRRERGSTYIFVLLFLAMTVAVAAVALEMWSTQSVRQKEAELLWIGAQFRQAIGLYYERTPGNVKRYPESLDELVEDRRYLSVQRYLRRIYRDPMTLSTNWGLVRAPNGGIMGVHSLSDAVPKRRIGPAPTPTSSQVAARYRDWAFIYVPGQSRLFWSGPTQ